MIVRLFDIHAFAICEFDICFISGSKNMTFRESIATCLKKYADLSDRASRSEYWWFTLFCVVVPTCLGFISEIVGALAFLALLLPQITASARRLHDIGKTGWMLLIGIIPLIG